jgi:uncharacterized protein (TIGR02118 family)
MIKASLLYPNVDGARFDYAYYLNSHLPMVKARLQAALKRLAVERGVFGTPGTPPPYIALGHLYFDSIEAMSEAYAPHAQQILDDIPNFTDQQPVMIVSEVLI